MYKRKKIYEGKTKILYEGPENGTAIQHFKDDASAYNKSKKTVVEGKGVLNNRISEHILNNLNQIGIKTHLIKRINMREQLVKLVKIIPVKFIIRNIASGSLTKRLGVPDGTVLSKPLIEYIYKKDGNEDSFVAKDHIIEFKLLENIDQLNMINKYSLRINDFIQGMFRGVGIKLVDLKLEFGIFKNGSKNEILLADEISPDNCRLWDVISEKKLDKDRFRKDLGNIVQAYKEVARRLGIIHEDGNISKIKFGKPQVIDIKKKLK